ncbi:MAG: peptidoglycan-binding domain-containing protein [Gemmatimonadota bacterium]|nr:peptidoglycan-binding domain-containing protein [Gemmatimonadota bacterium]
MNRLQPETGSSTPVPERSRTAMLLRAGTWIVLAVSLAGPAWWAWTREPDAADRAVGFLAAFPLFLILVDLWTLAIARFWRPVRSPLRVPARTPIVLAILHAVLWLCMHYLLAPEVFDRSGTAAGGEGDLAIRWGIALLFGVLWMVGTVAVFFEVRLLRWVLISEDTAVVEEKPEESEEPSDMPAGPEHTYEVQTILNGLGYETGPVDGELNDATREALRKFQADAGLEATGELTMLTVIELRNRWGER